MTIYKQYQIPKEDKKEFISLKKEYTKCLGTCMPYSQCNLSDIDKTLIPIIKKLNKLGFETSTCCSGLFFEHKNKDNYMFQDFENNKEKIDKRQEGFIIFSILPKEKKIKIKKIAEKSGLIFKFYSMCKTYFYPTINKTTYYCHVRDLRCRVLNPIPYKKRTKLKDIELKDKIMLKKWNKFYEELEKINNINVK